MNKKKNLEQGQITILFLFAVVALFGFAALAIDGGMIFLQRRAAQSAVDNAAMTGALAIVEKYNADQIQNIVLESINRNGFDTASESVSVLVNYPPEAPSIYAGNPEFIQVIMTSRVPKTFVQFVYQGPIAVTVEAIARSRISSSSGSGFAIFVGSQNCEKSIDWSGSSTVIEGSIHSNNDFYVGGSSNEVEGTTTFVSTVEAPGDKITFIPSPPFNPLRSGVQAVPISFNIDDFKPGGSKAQAPVAAGEYHYCDCKMDKGWLEDNGLYDDSTKELKPGIYFAEEEIDLSASDIVGGAVTFVSSGKITLGGSSHDLHPYVDGLLIFTNQAHGGDDQCSVAVVNMNGSTHHWSGIIFAPHGLIEMSGSSSTTLQGSLISNSLKLNGSELTITYDTSFIPTEPPMIDLAQ